MTLNEQVEAILGETVSALARLETEELEELERRIARIAAEYGPGSAAATRELEAKMDLLQACLNMTAENLTVLERARSRVPRVGVRA